MVLGPVGNRRFLTKTIPEGGGLRPPPSGMVFGAAGTAQTPNIDDFRPAPKPYIKNPSLCLRRGGFQGHVLQWVGLYGQIIDSSFDGRTENGL